MTKLCSDMCSDMPKALELVCLGRSLLGQHALLRQQSAGGMASITWPLLILIQEYIMYKEMAIAPASDMV